MINILSKIKLPGTKDRFSVGLDIGTQLIKCVKLKINGSDAELVSFGLDDVGLDPVEVFKKIKHDQSLDAVNISFCGSSTVIRYVNFLRMNKLELKQALKFEAQKLIPFSLEEVNLDAQILKNDLADNKMLVLIAVIKKELIQQRIKALETAALRPNIIDLDSLALSNAFNFNYPKIEALDNKSICLLNMGSLVSNVNILHNGLPRLSRDIHCGGAIFTKQLMDIFGINFNDAEKLKIEPTQDKISKVKTSFESELTNLATELRTSFDYYESQNNSNVIKIFLSGGGSKISGLKEMLGSCLGMEIETWNPFQQVKLTDKIDTQQLGRLSSHFNVAVGLALR